MARKVVRSLVAYVVSFVLSYTLFRLIGNGKLQLSYGKTFVLLTVGRHSFKAALWSPTQGYAGWARGTATGVANTGIGRGSNGFFTYYPGK